MSNKYEYVEYEKLSDAVRDWEKSGRVVYVKNEDVWYEANDIFTLYDTYAKRVLKPETRYETLYECIDSGGNLGLYNEKGRWPNVNIRTFMGVEKILRRTGRTLKLNLDTWEIEL